MLEPIQNSLPRTRDEFPPIRTALVVPVQQMHQNATVPTLGTEGAAAFDLYAVADGHIDGNSNAVIPVGIGMEIPPGYVGLICSRSGLAAKKNVFVLNAPGVIDSDYRGEIKLIMMNAYIVRFSYKAGDRLAQMMFIKHERVIFEQAVELGGTARGEGGFGSTGVSSQLVGM
jgi:dUTP pyrophosphatase